MTFSTVNNANASSSSPLLERGNRGICYGSAGTTERISVHPEVLSRMIHLRADQIQESSNYQTHQSLTHEDETPATGLAISIFGVDDTPDGEYVGEVKEGRPHGRGIATYKRHPERKNWKRYQGDWQDGKFHGFGLLILRNGATYDGQWQAGLLHGRAVVFEADQFQTRYEGEYVHGKKQGHGKRTWLNGEVQVYEGEWQEDKFHGRGRLVNPRGDIYEGDFVQSRISGRGKITWKFGDVYEGECRQSFDVKSGVWLFDFLEFVHGEGTMRRVNSVLMGLWKRGRLWSGTLSGEKEYTVIEGVEWLGDRKMLRISRDSVNRVYKCFCCNIN